MRYGRAQESDHEAGHETIDLYPDVELGRNIREGDAVALEGPEGSSDQAAEGSQEKEDPEGFDPELIERDETSVLHSFQKEPGTTVQFSIEKPQSWA